MGRRKLNIHRVHLNLFPDDMAKVEAIVGSKGVSKFVRDCIKEALAEIEPSEDKLEPPYFEFDGGQVSRLPYRYLYLHLLFHTLQQSSRFTFDAEWNAPLPIITDPIASVNCLMPDYYPRQTPRLVSCYALFK